MEHPVRIELIDNCLLAWLANDYIIQGAFSKLRLVVAQGQKYKAPNEN